MEDAYTVGIRLALDDGISAGIVSISNDLAMLNRALAESTIGLARLHAFSGNATTSATSDRQYAIRQNEQQNQSPESSPERMMSAPMPKPALVSVPSSILPALAMEATPPVVSHAPPPTLPARSLPPDFVAFAPAALLKPSVADTKEKIIRSPPFGQKMEKERPIFGGVEQPSTLAPKRIHDTKERPIFCEVEQLSTMVPKRIHDTSVVVPHVQPMPIPSPSDASGTERSSPLMKSPVTAITGIPQTTWERSPAGARASTEHFTTMLPQPSQHPSALPQTGLSQGDMYLDGARIGRWMARTLAHESMKPQNSTTQFDSRMGPAWPGTA